MDNKVVATACAGVLVVAGVYVLWGPGHWFKRKAKCPGLVNLGNTCFLNAILQGIASVPSMKKWLDTMASKHHGRLTVALRDTITFLSAGDDGSSVHSPVGILHALMWHSWQLNFEQQDAHELYHVLLTTLEEEVSWPARLCGINQLLEGGTCMEPVTSKASVKTKAGNVSPPMKSVSCPLQGLLTSGLVCCHCNYSFPRKYECFDSLSLTLTPLCSLQACLMEYVKSEVILDVECPKCSLAHGHSMKRSFLKQLGVGRAPHCLCVHLQRNVWTSDGGLYKNTSHVSFPVHLDASGIMTTLSSEVWYELLAVIEHAGGAMSGHYITYRRTPTDEGKRTQWAYTSDTSVHTVSLQRVMKANAYMLFYQRIQ